MKTRHTVGYLITADKASKHLTESFRQSAKEALIDVVTLDGKAPLEQQADLHAIVHKAIGNAVFEQRLAEFLAKHPEVPIIDAMDNARLLRDRAKMLGGLTADGISVLAPHDAAIKSQLVGRPPQVVVPRGTTCGEALELLDSAGLRLPLVVKPQHGGQKGSHEVAIVKDLAGLQAVVTAPSQASLQPPVILQQFVCHGSSITKVYVAGAGVVAVQRPTFEADQGSISGFVMFDRVSRFPRAQPSAHPTQSGSHLPADREASGRSDTVAGAVCIEVAGNYAAEGSANMASLADSFRQDSSEGSGQQSGAPESQPAFGGAHHHQSADGEGPSSSTSGSDRQHPPPEWLLRGLAATLRHNTGLQLFNFDLLSPTATSSLDSSAPDYFVVDINFFPGFEKLPNYESLMVSFLRGVVTGSTTDGGYGDSSFLACCQMSPGC